MYKVILLFLLLCISIFSSEIKTKIAEFPTQEMKKQNTKIAALTAESLSKDLPHAIDQYTTLTKIVSDNTTLIWTFEINTGAKSDESVKQQDRTRMQKAITKGICQSSEKFLMAGIDTIYIYLSAKTKSELFRFHISKKDCIGI